MPAVAVQCLEQMREVKKRLDGLVHRKEDRAKRKALSLTQRTRRPLVVGGFSSYQAVDFVVFVEYKMTLQKVCSLGVVLSGMTQELLELVLLKLSSERNRAISVTNKQQHRKPGRLPHTARRIFLEERLQANVGVVC